jgi:hypothetical protein
VSETRRDDLLFDGVCIATMRGMPFLLGAVGIVVLVERLRRPSQPTPALRVQ